MRNKPKPASKQPKPKPRPVPPYDPASDIVRSHHLPQACGVSTVTAWKLRKKGEFPNPIRLSDKINGWLRSDLEKWKRSRRRVRPGGGSPIVAA